MIVICCNIILYVLLVILLYNINYAILYYTTLYDTILYHIILYYIMFYNELYVMTQASGLTQNYERQEGLQHVVCTYYFNVEMKLRNISQAL